MDAHFHKPSEKFPLNITFLIDIGKGQRKRILEADAAQREPLRLPGPVMSTKRSIYASISFGTRTIPRLEISTLVAFSPVIKNDKPIKNLNGQRQKAHKRIRLELEIARHHGVKLFRIVDIAQVEGNLPNDFRKRILSHVGINAYGIAKRKIAQCFRGKGVAQIDRNLDAYILQLSAPPVSSSCLR